LFTVGRNASVDVDAAVGEVDAQRDGRELERVDHVARERRPGRDDLVAGVERGLADISDHGVGAGCDDDLLEGHTVLCGERLAKAITAPVRVAVRLGQRSLDRLDRLGERAERAFVRSELDDAPEPELALDRLDGLARLVRDEPVEGRPNDPGHTGIGSSTRSTSGATSIAVSHSAASPPASFRQATNAPAKMPTSASAPSTLRTRPRPAVLPASAATLAARRRSQRRASQETTAQTIAFRWFRIP
jgi:hypothetical protein